MRLAEIYENQPIIHIVDTIEQGLSNEHVGALLAMRPADDFLGYRIVPSEVEPGWTWDGKRFLPPLPDPALPMPTLEEVKAQRLTEIQMELDEIDQKMTRPIGAITMAIIGKTDPDRADRERLRELQSRKATLREAMAQINAAGGVKAIHEITW